MHAAGLKAAYDAEFECLDRLALLLEKEREALRTRDVNGICDCSGKKEELVRQLEILDSQRRKLASRFTEQEIRDANLENFIKDSDARLKTTLEKFQHANHINFGIAEMSRIFTRQLLAILHGQSGQSSETYDLKGDHRKTELSHSLAKV